MPTGAKLVSAIFFAALAWISTDLYQDQLPEQMRSTMNNIVALLIGIFCGWMVMGRLAGRGWIEAGANGLRTAVTAALSSLLVLSSVEMLRLSLRKRYDGPMEALLAVFAILIDYGALALTPAIIGTLLIGGVLGGIAAEWASRRWA